MSWIQTFTGRKFDLVNPTPDMVAPLDIEIALSRIPRFTGHTRRFYSVAEHSLYVADNVTPCYRLHALLHDATEAYIGDLSTPLKQVLGEGIKQIERGIWLAIAERFGLAPELPHPVKQTDLQALMTERDALLDPPPEPWDGLEEVERLMTPFPSPDSPQLAYRKALSHYIGEYW